LRRRGADKLLNHASERLNRVVEAFNRASERLNRAVEAFNRARQP
jgi:hypothetical protein